MCEQRHKEEEKNEDTMLVKGRRKEVWLEEMRKGWGDNWCEKGVVLYHQILWFICKSWSRKKSKWALLRTAAGLDMPGVDVGFLQQWFPTLGPQMFLDYNSQKSWPAQLLVKASGSFSPRTTGVPKLGTTAL